MNEPTFPTVTEDEADTITRQIYQDIKSTMGVALVNLVWRHLAVSPQVLQWSWQVLKPHYTGGAIQSAAWLLRESLDTPQLAPVTSDEWQYVDSTPGNIEADTNRETSQAFKGQNISEQITNLDAVLQTYERGNAQNLIAMCYLQACLDNTIDETHRMPALNNQQRSAEQKDRLARQIPPLPEWNGLHPVTVTTITAMTTTWVPVQYRGFTPSVFRHISYWPEFLQLYCSRLQQLHSSSSESLDSLSEQTIKHASRLARQMGPVTPAIHPLSVEDQQWLQIALTRFIEGMISRGVVIVPAMRAMLESRDAEVTRC
jgi:hypothetical protein